MAALVNMVAALSQVTTVCRRQALQPAGALAERQPIVAISYHHTQYQPPVTPINTGRIPRLHNTGSPAGDCQSG